MNLVQLRLFDIYFLKTSEKKLTSSKISPKRDNKMLPKIEEKNEEQNASQNRTNRMLIQTENLLLIEMLQKQLNCMLA